MATDSITAANRSNGLEKQKQEKRSGLATAAILRAAYTRQLNEPIPPMLLKSLKKASPFFHPLKDGDVMADAVALGLIRRAVNRGEPGPAREMREATDGKAAQRVEIGPADRRIEIVLVKEPLPPEIAARSKVLTLPATSSEPGDEEK
jgi:hypothetical protein